MMLDQLAVSPKSAFLMHVFGGGVSLLTKYTMATKSDLITHRSPLSTPLLLIFYFLFVWEYFMTSLFSSTTATSNPVATNPIY